MRLRGCQGLGVSDIRGLEKLAVPLKSNAYGQYLLVMLKEKLF